MMCAEVIQRVAPINFSLLLLHPCCQSISSLAVFFSVHYIGLDIQIDQTVDATALNV